VARYDVARLLVAKSARFASPVDDPASMTYDARPAATAAFHVNKTVLPVTVALRFDGPVPLTADPTEEAMIRIGAADKQSAPWLRRHALRSGTVVAVGLPGEATSKAVRDGEVGAPSSRPQAIRSRHSATGNKNRRISSLSVSPGMSVALR